MDAATVACREEALMLTAIDADQDAVCAALGKSIDDFSGIAISPQAKRLIQNLAAFESLSQLNTSEQSTESLRRLLLVMVEDPRTVLLALVRHIRLLREAIAQQSECVAMLAQAARQLYGPLAGRLGVAQLKWELEDLSFRVLEPSAYKSIAKRLEEKRLDREAYVERFIEDLGQRLREVGIDGFEVSGRVKHLYSIHRKMQKKDLRYDQLFDLRAVRLLLSNVADCYTALGIVHGAYAPIPGQFDDYIGQPKPNGYQSLHTVVMGPNNKSVEIQMRTFDMHREAELGVAAHWQYKEGGNDQSAHRVVQRLRALLEQGELADELNSEDLFSERVFALTPRGDVIDLAQGATPLDFAYAIHTSVGHRCRGAKVNGGIVPLTYALKNADSVEVLTSKEESPSRDWLIQDLGYLQTNRARNKVRHYFNQLDHAQHLEDGREIVERQLRRFGLELGDVQKLVQRFRVANPDDVYVGVGRGEISATQLIAALEHIVSPPAEITTRKKRATTTSKSDVHVQGVGQLLTQLASCCQPVPNEPIVGLITKTKGVSIHRSDCINMLNLPDSEHHRLIEVSWGEEPERNYAVRLQLEAYRRDGLLRDIGQVLANRKVRLLDIQSHYDDAQDTQFMTLEVELSDSNALGVLLHQLHALPNVISAKRGR